MNKNFNNSETQFTFVNWKCAVILDDMTNINQCKRLQKTVMFQHVEYND